MKNLKIIVAFAVVYVIGLVTSDVETDVQLEVDSQDAQIDSQAVRPKWPPKWPSRLPKPGRPKRIQDNDQEADAEAPISDNQDTSSGMPETDNYDQDGLEADCYGCCCRGWWCCRRGRGRRSVVTEGEQSEQGDEPMTVLGSKTELKLYKSKEDLGALSNTPVIRADLYERPLEPSVDRSISLALGGRQYGVVVTLNDGRRFLVVKGNQMGRGSKTVAIISNHMTDDWTKVDTKAISSSTLGDFVKAGGHRFDAFKDNGREAAFRMMALQ